MGEHEGPEDRAAGEVRPVRAAGEPGEQVGIGRFDSVPHFLDLPDRRIERQGQRHPGEPRRHADAQAAGDQLEQRPAPCCVEPVEPAGDQAAHLRPAGAAQGLDDIGEPGRFGIGLRLPQQRRRFRQIADIVVGQREQHLVGLFAGQVADRAGLGVGKIQIAGERRQCPTAVPGPACAGNSPPAGAACRCARACKPAGRAAQRSSS